MLTSTSGECFLHLSSFQPFSLGSWLISSAGDLNSDELERIVTIIQNPTQYKIPTWFLNRQKDIVDGKNYQILSNGVDSKLRDDLERLKKIRAHRGLRHFWGLRVRGQHTKTTGAYPFQTSFTMQEAKPLYQVVAARPSVCPKSAVKRVWTCMLLGAGILSSSCLAQMALCISMQYDMREFFLYAMHFLFLNARMLDASLTYECSFFTF